MSEETPEDRSQMSVDESLTMTNRSPYLFIEHMKWFFFGDENLEGEPRFGFGDFWSYNITQVYQVRRRRFEISSQRN